MCALNQAEVMLCLFYFSALPPFRGTYAPAAKGARLPPFFCLCSGAARRRRCRRRPGARRAPGFSASRSEAEKGCARCNVKAGRLVCGFCRGSRGRTGGRTVCGFCKCACDLHIVPLSEKRHRILYRAFCGKDLFHIIFTKISPFFHFSSKV